MNAERRRLAGARANEVHATEILAAAADVECERIAVGWRDLPTFVLAEADVTRDAEGLVRLPYRLPSGSRWANRVVATSGRRWWEPGDGRPVIPFGLDRLEHPDFRRYRVLAICEGESDGLALRAAFGAEGFDVLGIPGACTWRAEWAGHAAGYAAVYVLGDGDDAGRCLNRGVRGVVPDAIAVELPEGRDVRELLQEDGVDALLAMIALAEVESAALRAFREARDLDDYRAHLAALATRGVA